MDAEDNQKPSAKAPENKGNTRTLLASLADLNDKTIEFFSLCRQKLQIYTRNLDPRILNNREIEKIISRFVRSSRFARVEILITDERNLQGTDHRLVSLAQKYTSFVQIRVIPKDFHENYFGFYLIDGRAMIYRNNVERFESECHILPSSLIKQKAKYFDDVWQQSAPASQLRALNL